MPSEFPDWEIAKRPPRPEPEAALESSNGKRVSDFGYFTIWLLRNAVATLPGGVLRRLDLLATLLPRVLTNPRTVCFCQPVVSTISASVTPLARFIIAITSAFAPTRPSSRAPLPASSA
jgi:hypothetical protein